ncbi:MAG: response regulator transcription factor [Cyclobacteriaceae bacterium]|nr:response regulator transcription factor [Cyclobacteriaceae bacterium HetDA_MAG_MS6]
MISFGSITDITSSRDISGITLSVFKEQGDRNDLVFTTKYPFRKVRFSKRELEVLELLAQGQTSKDIAKHLYISDKTVNNHRQKMLKKMGVKSTSALISQASKLDLL